jgi:hypothetical protein
MDISSARLAALLKEAMTPQAVPLAKADPGRAALVKALVQPPAPSLLAKQTAPALLALPAAQMVVKSQQIASAGIVEAYRAQVESSEGAAPATVVARKTAPEAEARRDIVPPLARANDTVSARPAALSLLALVAPQHPAPRRAPAPDASAGRGKPTNQPHGATPLNHERLLLKIGFVSTTAVLLAAAAFGLVLRILS